MVEVKGGTFTMGCFIQEKECESNSLPIHEVSVEDFFISRYEITNAQYCTFLNEAENVKVVLMDNNRYVAMDDYNSAILVYEYEWGIQYNRKNSLWEPANGYDFNPIVFVTWFGAKSFCEWVGGRLPSEEEWEYAAKGGHKSEGKEYIFAGTHYINNASWYKENSNGVTHQVGTKDPNQLGLYDMSGNVYEWCEDFFITYQDKVKPPLKPRNAFNRVIRGGCWKSKREEVTVFHRLNSPFIAYNYIGFRVCKNKE